MRKLAHYLKPYTALILICFGLLFGQAMCDLNLPNYMSDIVNVGIQQNGIEHASPEAVSRNGFELLRVFMTAEQKQTVSEHYRLVETGSAAENDDYEQLASWYPLLKEQDIYVRSEADGETLETLDEIFGQTTWTMVNFLQQMSEGQQTATDTSDLSDMDFSKIYAVLPQLAMLPEETFDEARRAAAETPESMQSQSGAMLAKLFYTELGMDIGGIQTRYILKTGLMMLLLTLLGAVATIAVTFLATRIAAAVARNMRRDVFSKVESFSNSEFDLFSTASLITRTTNNVTQIQMLIIMGIRMLCYAPIMGVGGVVMALQKSVSMSWTIALAVIVLIGLIVVIFNIAMPKFKMIQKLVDKLNLVTRENLSGMMVIRAFGTQKFEEERFDKANKDLTGTNLFVNRVMVFMMPAMMFIMNCVSLLIVWVGANQIADSTMQVGDMMAFMQYAMQIIGAFLMISMMFIMVPRAAVSVDRVAEVLDTEPRILDPKEPKSLENCRGLVEFRDVSFRYGGAEDDVLEHISFTARPGETTAFIGSTGSGKSTLINLIPRFYDVTGGAILIDGVDIREVSQHDLREQIGYVPQKGVLFSGTVASNLRYGDREASNDTVQTAARVAQAEDFIRALPEGFDADISQGGSNVSGGQKQRLSIARALVKRAPINIFDDSFSALDFKTDAALRRALKEYTGQSTVLIVAQRVSTIMHAEQIIVLDEGRIVGKGTHKELLESCETYREIASSQLSKEELQ